MLPHYGQRPWCLNAGTNHQQSQPKLPSCSCFRCSLFLPFSLRVPLTSNEPKTLKHKPETRQGANTFTTLYLVLRFSEHPHANLSSSVSGRRVAATLRPPVCRVVEKVTLSLYLHLNQFKSTNHASYSTLPLLLLLPTNRGMFSPPPLERTYNQNYYYYYY